MAILISRDSRFVIQGITGNMGRFCAADMIAYGTQVVAGVANSRAATPVEGVPVFGTVCEAVEHGGANVSIVFAPAVVAMQQVLEAFDAGIRFVIYPGDGLPLCDAIELRRAAQSAGSSLLGPNTPGLITPGEAKAGFMPSFAYLPGNVGVISRSGSLSYEVCHRLTMAGIGQSTVVGIGGDPVKGLTVDEVIAHFHRDPATSVIMYLGEIGGKDEYAVAEYAGSRDAKPVAALIVGSSAPAGKKMGHAAALIGSHADTHEAKLKALIGHGVAATGQLSQVVAMAKQAIAQA